jgi:hypothetical protein
LCLFKEYVNTPCYVSSDEKGLESAVGKTEEETSDRLSGKVCP